MAIVSLSTIKNWFRTGDKPTQVQFNNVWDSFRHKSEAVPVSDVSGLEDNLNSLVSEIGGKEDKFTKNSAFNLDISSQEQAEAGVNNASAMTPLRVFQSFATRLTEAIQLYGIWQFMSGLNSLEIKIRNYTSGSFFSAVSAKVANLRLDLGGSSWTFINFLNPIKNWIHAKGSPALLEINEDGTSQAGPVIKSLVIVHPSIIAILKNEENWDDFGVFVGDLSEYIDHAEQGMYFFDDTSGFRYSFQENDIITKSQTRPQNIQRSKEITFTGVSSEVFEIGRIKYTGRYAGIITVSMTKKSGGGAKPIGSIEAAFYLFAANSATNFSRYTPFNSSIAEDTATGSGVDIFDLTIDEGEVVLWAKNGGTRYAADVWMYNATVGNISLI
jgi:hypothetical protein